MNIKFSKSEVMGNLKIDAIFPPQKRTILLYFGSSHIKHLDPEKILFLNFPKLVFRLACYEAVNKHWHYTFSVMGLNDKNEILYLNLPNVDRSYICLGNSPPMLDQKSTQELYNKPTQINAKNIILPFINFFWNSKFTVEEDLSLDYLYDKFNKPFITHRTYTGP